MRLTLALTVAAAAAVSLAPAAHASCRPQWDKGDLYVYTCTAPGASTTTTVCYQATDTCVTL